MTNYLNFRFSLVCSPGPSKSTIPVCEVRQEQDSSLAACLRPETSIATFVEARLLRSQ